MKKTLLIAAMMFGALSINAQQNVKFQTACHPDDVKHYDTKTLRERFVMEKVMEADKINLTYSHYDRFIYGGAMPVTKTLKLENFLELGLDVDKTIKEKYFLYNRELGVVNCGEGDGVVIVDGKEYALSPKEALYIGRGHIAEGCEQVCRVPFKGCPETCEVLPQLSNSPQTLQDTVDYPRRTQRFSESCRLGTSRFS